MDRTETLTLVATRAIEHDAALNSALRASHGNHRALENREGFMAHVAARIHEEVVERKRAAGEPLSYEV